MILLTPKEVAERLRVSPRTVYSWIEDGRLASVRLSERVTRVPQDAVDALVSGSLVAGEAPALYEAPSAIRAGATTGSPSERIRAQLALHREEIVRIAADNRAENVRVFGSVARGDAHDDSDVDLLVDAGADASLFDLGRITAAVCAVLHRRVDVVASSDLKPLVRDTVLAEASPL
jgi:excisionase family DNA binding protein